MHKTSHKHGVALPYFFTKRQYIVLITMTLAFIVGAVLVTLPNYLAAHAVNPTLTVTPASGYYGSRVKIKVQGANFGANETVKVYWNYTGPGTGTLEATVTTDATGVFSTKFSAPLAATGTYTIAGKGQISGLVATGTYVLLPHLFVLPIAAGTGTPISIQGNAFGAGETVNIYWNYTGPGTGTLLTSAIGDVTGSFTATAMAPSSPAGHVPIAGIGQASHTSSTYTFILYPPTLALAPLSGSANTILTLSAYGFKNNEAVNIYWNKRTKPIRTVTSSLYGSISPLTIIIPAGLAPGIYPIKAVGQVSNITITNNYMVVTPSSSLSFTSGPVGVSVNVSGQGYAPNEAVRILWDYNGPGTGMKVASVTAGSSGIVNANFVVPTAVPGAYIIAIVGATSNTVTQNTFTVSNGLASSPATTSPSKSVTISGTGFQASESVKLFLDSISGNLLTTAAADVHGNISQVVTMPSNTPPGIHAVIGIGKASGQSYTASVKLDTSWGDFGFDNAHHRNNLFENTLSPSNVTNLKLKWIAQTAKGLRGSPIYANGVTYTATFDGQLKAYNATTGTLIWQYNSNMGFESPSAPLIDPTTNMVFFGTMGYEEGGVPTPFFALNAQTGALLWSMIIPWNDFGFPTLAFNTIYLGNSHENGPAFLYALDELTGHLVWQYNTNGGVWGAVAADTSTNAVFTAVGNPSDQVISLNASTGAVNWKYTVPHFEGDDDPGSGILVDNGFVYVNSKNGSLYAIHENDGTIAWSRVVGTLDNGNVSSPALTNGTLYVGSLDKNLYALNATGGTVLWKTFVAGKIYSSPAIANGIVYFASINGNIYAVRATDGKALWQFELGRGSSYSSPIVANGWLYCGSSNGKLFAFSF